MSEIEEMLEPLAQPRFDWLQIEVAGVCNAACAYCALTCYKGVREGGLMDMGTFERLAPHFSSAALVFLQGWGEPLLHPQFWEMARRAKASGARVAPYHQRHATGCGQPRAAARGPDRHHGREHRRDGRGDLGSLAPRL